jgi:citrate synthase
MPTMKIGKSTVPRTAISTSDEHSITVRGRDLCSELIGHTSFSAYFWLLLTGQQPNAAQLAVLDATLVAIAEHGFVPSVQAARMTLAAAPDALQGAVAAGILGCGSVILGASETAGRLFDEIHREAGSGAPAPAAAAVVKRWRAAGQPVPGYGHPLHKERDPRVAALFRVAQQARVDQRYVQIADAVEQVIPEAVGKALKLNVSAAIPAVLLGAGFPLAALRGVPILARTASLIAHLNEELSVASGFALSYQATRELVYDGEAVEKNKA